MIRRALLMLILSALCTLSFGQIESSKPPEALIAEAREILRVEGDANEAIAALNQILLLPPNELTREAHELIITAYERAGKPLRAAAEIRLYLQLYPDSDVAKRVRERLLAIEIANPQKLRSTLETRQPRTDSATKLDASVSQYLYGSSSTASPLSYRSEQLTAITNVRATGEYRFGDAESRITVRGTQNIDTTRHETRRTLQLANLSVLNSLIGYEVRLGRQHAQYGAVSRFDGATAKYDFGNGVRLGAALGSPEMYGSSDSRFFQSVGVEYDPTAALTFSAYLTRQTVRGFEERRAIGGDLRVSRDGSSAMLIADYDLLYHRLNSVLLQGLTTIREYSLYSLLERRRSPMLLADRGLYLGTELAPHVAFDSIQTLLSSQYSTSQIRSFIVDTTPTATSYVLGVTKHLSDEVDVSTNVQLTNISSVLDSLFVPTPEAPVSTLQSPGSGLMRSLTVQLYAQNVLHRQNSVSVLLTRSQSRDSSSTSLTGTDTERFQNLKLELTSRAHFQSQAKSTRFEVMGSIRGNYRTSERTSIEAQVGLARIETYDKDAAFRSTRYNQTFFVGARWDY